MRIMRSPGSGLVGLPRFKQPTSGFLISTEALARCRNEFATMELFQQFLISPEKTLKPHC
jgi:hypothetical protein